MGHVPKTMVNNKMLSLICILIISAVVVLAINKSQILESGLMFGADIYTGIPMLADVNSSNNCIGFYCIMDYYPNQTIPKISPSPAENNDNLTCLVQTYYDYETTAPSANYTEWFINDSLIATSYNLSSTLTGLTDKVICSKIVFDGVSNSTTRNSSQVTIGDSTPPVINKLSLSSSSVVYTSSVTFYINITDAASEIETDACEIGLYQSNIITQYFNLTTDTKSLNILSKRLSTLSPGTLQWRYLWCSDSSNNSVQNLSVTLNISVTTPTSGGTGTPAGGAGAGAAKEPEIIIQNITAEFCGDNICQDTESPISCAEDCKFNFDTLFDFGPEGAIHQAWFATMIIYGLLGLSMIVIARRQMALSKNNKHKKKSVKQWFKKAKESIS